MYNVIDLALRVRGCKFDNKFYNLTVKLYFFNEKFFLCPRKYLSSGFKDFCPVSSSNNFIVTVF